MNNGEVKMVRDSEGKTSTAESFTNSRGLWHSLGPGLLDRRSHRKTLQWAIWVPLSTDVGVESLFLHFFLLSFSLLN